MPRRKINESAEEVKAEGEPVEEVVSEHEDQVPLEVTEKIPEAVSSKSAGPDFGDLPEVEGSIEGSMPGMRVFPQVRVGVCEFHGTPWGIFNTDTLRGRCGHKCSTDPKCPHSVTGCEKYRDPQSGEPAIRPGERYCRHEHNYNGLKMQCTFCPSDVDLRGVMKTRTMYVFQSPEDPKRLVVVCSDYRCRDKFFKRFMIGVV